MRCVVGIDGGGTKTRAVAYHIEANGEPLMGRIAGACDTGACNIAFMQLDDALANVEAAIKGACPDDAEIVSICAGVAGFSFVTRREQFEAALQSSHPNSAITVTSDFAAAFRGALPKGIGILAVAGTGSVVYGSNGAGVTHRAGGYGYIVDDAGSGYGVGRTALASVLRAIDGTGAQTTLTERIYADLGIGGWDALIEAIYGGGIDRVKIASFAKTVSRSANEDSDEIATQILMRAGGALAKLAEAVHSRVFSRDDAQPIPIICTGSLWGAGPVLIDVFRRSVHRFATSAMFMDAQNEPVYGAALMAAEAVR